MAGYFSQIGQLYIAHHIFHYDDYQNRKDVREAAWRKPGWDDVVSYTGKKIGAKETNCGMIIVINRF